MDKHVFRPYEVSLLSEVVKLEQAIIDPDPVPLEEIAPVEEAPMPDLDELHRNAEQLLRHTEAERRRLIDEATVESERIVAAAREEAERRATEIRNEAETERATAHEEAERLRTEAERLGEELMSETKARIAALEAEGMARGEEQGRTIGFEQGQNEVARLVQSLHAMLSKLIARRNEILEEAEIQLVELVLLIARKVVRIVSEEQREVVRRTVVAALEKVKTKSDIIIRINPGDLDVATERKREFMEMVEQGTSISLVEDSEIEPGGCLIETDIGEIDARIASQLQIIENEIRRVMPVRRVAERRGER